MSAVSILKKKTLSPLDANVNEFAALENLDPEARPVQTRSRRVDAEEELQSNAAGQEDLKPASWIRNNIKVTQTRKGSRVTWTPWKNGSELAMVRDWFFADHAIKDPYSPPTEDLRKAAINTVSQWEAQNRDLELPHSILATASLSDATLHDTKPTTERLQHISDHALQSIYAMAFCRFVNGFVDRDVTKSSLTAMATATVTDEDGLTTSTSRNESSMYALATKIGMPLRFVEMRHQITHERMPSIEELAGLAEDALEWMYQRWWKINASFDSAEAWDTWRTTEEQRVSKRSQQGVEKRRASEETLDGSHGDKRPRIEEETEAMKET
jgi:Las1-like